MIIVIMGVAGAGKTTVGRELARRLGWQFVDADDFHPPANREKIARGEPLDDADRAPWLDALGALMARGRQVGQDLVVACSALRAAYRDRLSTFAPGLVWVHLRLEPEEARARIARRRGHFASPLLVESQFDALEEPQTAVVLDASSDVDTLITSIAGRLGLKLGPPGAKP
jgi:gluconokinase